MKEDTALRFATSLESINARIARLAIALDVQLDDASEVAQIMNARPSAPLQAQHPAASDPMALSKAVTPEHRMEHKRDELRGLLVLRLEIEARSIQDHGLSLTRQMMTQTEARLAQMGFKHGADGAGLDDFINPSGH